MAEDVHELLESIAPVGFVASDRNEVYGQDELHFNESLVASATGRLLKVAMEMREMHLTSEAPLQWPPASQLERRKRSRPQ